MGATRTYGTLGETWHRGSREIGFRSGRRRIISRRSARDLFPNAFNGTFYAPPSADRVHPSHPEAYRKRTGNARLFIAGRPAKTDGSSVVNVPQKQPVAVHDNRHSRLFRRASTNDSRGRTLAVFSGFV